MIICSWVEAGEGIGCSRLVVEGCALFLVLVCGVNQMLDVFATDMESASCEACLLRDVVI